jgi:hypothetical protein
MNATRSRVWLDGLNAGLIGYATVALFIGLVDLLSGRSFFYTASLLGQSVIGGFGDPTPGLIAPGPIFAYNGVHVLVFVAIGLLIAWLVYEIELHPMFWYVVFFVLLGVFFFSFILLAIVATPVSESVPWWSFLAANAIAALAIGGYFHRTHPRLWTEVTEHGDPEYESAD